MKRMLTKSKTKADILSMLDRISAQHGGAMSIPMLRVDQLSLIHISWMGVIVFVFIFSSFPFRVWWCVLLSNTMLLCGRKSYSANPPNFSLWFRS